VKPTLILTSPVICEPIKTQPIVCRIKTTTVSCPIVTKPVICNVVTTPSVCQIQTLPGCPVVTAACPPVSLACGGIPTGPVGGPVSQGEGEGLDALHGETASAATDEAFWLGYYTALEALHQAEEAREE